MKEVVLKLDLHDERDKQRAMKRAAEITGLDSVSVDMKDKKLTVTGDDFDPVKVVSKLRKLFHTDIVTVGEPKKPEAKKEEPEAKKTEEGGKDKKNPEQVLVPYYYKPHPCGYYHNYGRCAYVANDEPNACVIL
ncbi:Heavy metal-associated isoprenylated plant protein 39 [Linum perenne]